MQVANAQQIETALDQMKSADYWRGHEWVAAGQAKEIGSALPNTSEDFRSGVELGIQVARVMLATMPAAIIAKVSI